MNIHKFVSDLKKVKKERTSGFKERFTWRQGTTTLCESKDHYEYLDTFSTSLTKGEFNLENISIRSLFEECVEDGRELVQSWDPRYGPGSGYLVEAAGAIASSDFSNISGQIVYTRLIEKMMLEDYVFTKMIPTQTTPYSGEKIAGIDGLGDKAEIVAELQPYPTIGVSEDWIETPATTKRGFIVPISKEAIFFDRTNRLLQEAGKVGEWLAVNKEKRAIDCVIDENTTIHRYKWKGTAYATYQGSTPWINITASNGLVDWTDIDKANATFNVLTDPSTGEPIVVKADTLICDPALEMVANRIVNATQIVVGTGTVTHAGGYATTGDLVDTHATNSTYLLNPLRGAFNIVTTRLLTARQATDTTWYYGSPSRAFVYMENWPITVIKLDEGPDMFSRDIVTQFRCSERGQYAVIEPRYMVECTA